LKRRRFAAPSAASAVATPENQNPQFNTIMATSEVLLVKPVDGLGGEGDQVKVRAGYARNYLLPRKIAVPLTGANRKQVDALKKRRAEREQTELTLAQDLAKKLEKTSLAFAVKTGEGGRMFGAITSQDVHDKLAASGIELEKKKIHLFTPVKTLGKHTVKIKLHADVAVELGFDVVSENPIEPAATEVAPAPVTEKRFERTERRPRKE
jgi:large subunit ribosomal protein L9